MVAHSFDRREFLKSAGTVAAGLGLGRWSVRTAAAADKQPLYKISLAEWSLHRMLAAKDLDPLDFARYSRKEFDIDAVEYVNQFFADKAQDKKYLADMNQRAGDAGVRNVLIMIDREGALGDAQESQRKKAVENHYKWVEAAKFLGCHSIRVNAQSKGSYEEQQKLAAEGLRMLSEFAASHEINVIVENHGGLSSNGAWLAAVIKQVGLPNCGTLPDFGNFRLSKTETYDRYTGVAELMPSAKAVSAKSYEFDDQGNETQIDYRRMMKIVLDAGYHGYVGIEYEGKQLSEPEGIKLTKKLLEKVRTELSV
jgi:L-ribulose-5-phosphate 3-epimerase